jgi:hypothetical protein
LFCAIIIGFKLVITIYVYSTFTNAMPEMCVNLLRFLGAEIELILDPVDHP